MICHFIYFQGEKAKGKLSEFQPNLIMLGLSPTDYVLKAVSNVQTSDLEQTLVVNINNNVFLCDLFIFLYRALTKLWLDAGFTIFRCPEAYGFLEGLDCKPRQGIWGIFAK